MLWQAHFSETRKEMTAAAGKSSVDLLITLYEVPGENISRGEGDAPSRNAVARA